MRKKIYLFSLVVTCFSLVGIAQQMEMLNDESRELRKKIIEKSNTTNTIISDFIQYKHLDFLSNDIKSTGKLVFKAPDLIKWEYLEPFKYSVVFKNDKLLINDDGVKSKIDLTSNKSFKSLNSLIIKSVKGDMFDENSFDIEYFKNSKNYLVTFQPKTSSVKSFVNEFILTYDKVSLNVIEIKMKENSEDYTLLKFINQSINENVGNEVFSN